MRLLPWTAQPLPSPLPLAGSPLAGLDTFLIGYRVEGKGREKGDVVEVLQCLSLKLHVEGAFQHACRAQRTILVTCPASLRRCCVPVWTCPRTALSKRWENLTRKGQRPHISISVQSEFQKDTKEKHKGLKIELLVIGLICSPVSFLLGLKWQNPTQAFSSQNGLRKERVLFFYAWMGPGLLC